MKVAFYKGSGRIFDSLVRWWTKGKFSHCELILSSGDMPLSASSSFRDGGVRTAYIDYNKHPERWEILDLSHLDHEIIATANSWFYSNLGKPYDVLGLFGFVIRSYSGDKNKYFCSEAIAAAFGFAEAWRFDPNTLYIILKNWRGKHAAE